MNRDDRSSRGLTLPGWLRAVSVAGIAVGIGGIAVGFRAAPLHAWLWLLVCYLFFAGMVHGALAWAAAFRVAQARWTSTVNRLGHSAIAFLPVLIVTLIILLARVSSYAPWATRPVPAKEAWLNLPFMVARDAACVGVLYVLFFLLVRWSLGADSQTEITQRSQFRLTAVATAALITYSVAGSVIAFDLIMSLSPEWISTMFAPYFWISNLYAGMALLILLSWLLRGPLQVEQHLGSQQFQDMGNLMLGFSLFCMGLFFAQYLTIWYGNVPNETRFLILRYYKGTWPHPAWTAFIIEYATPFVLLQSRRVKRTPGLVAPVAILAIIGVGMERYVMVVPSLEPHGVLMYLPPALVVLAFLGGLVLSIGAFLRRYSPVSSADEALQEASMGQEALT